MGEILTHGYMEELNYFTLLVREFRCCLDTKACKKAAGMPEFKPPIMRNYGNLTNCACMNMVQSKNQVQRGFTKYFEFRQ